MLIQMLNHKLNLIK